MAYTRTIIIGAGFAGIGMGAQLKRLLKGDNFQIFEKLDDVGGTWAQNTYPNLSCDVPSQVPSFPLTMAQFYSARLVTDWLNGSITRSRSSRTPTGPKTLLRSRKY
jgi:cation diffusion facilitator CzcD-associated flavoprotein CzcO